MRMDTRLKRFNSGFSLVEMAIVMAIVGLLLGGLLPTISSQIEQSRRSETRKQMDEIQQALMGYAIINGFLPCPMLTTTTNPNDASYGVAPATCAAPTAEGLLPWKTLGVSETDAWGSKRSSADNPWTGYWRYRVDRNFTTSFTLNTGFGTCSPIATTDCLAIQDNSGNTITTTTERPVAVIFSTGPNVIANGHNASYEATSGIYQSDVPNATFDDILVWISRPQLFNRMVAAGKLP